MTQSRKRRGRWTWIAAVLLACGLSFAPGFTPPVRAQEVPDASDGDKGRPLDGYLATITLMLLALFLVGKSARR